MNLVLLPVRSARLLPPVFLTRQDPQAFAAFYPVTASHPLVAINHTGQL